MRPLPLVLVAASATAALVGFAAWQMPRQVELPEFAGKVTFFDESRQAILVGDTPKGIKNLSANACASCHEKEHAQWKESAHARSVTEPVFAAAFKAEPRFLCRSCHSPLQEQHPVLLTRLDKAPKTLMHGTSVAPHLRFQAQQAILTENNPHFNPQLAAEGVTCVTCHVREGTVLTSKPTASNKVPHPLSYAPVLKKAEFCAGCHQFDVNNPGSHPFEPSRPAMKSTREVELASRRVRNVTFQMPDPTGEEPPIPPSPGMENQYQQEPRVQHTVDEFRISPAAARGETCQSCHMPAGKDSHGHFWPGRNDPEMLRKALELAVRLDRKQYAPGEKLQAVIKLKNQGGHRFPTGDSVHAGILDVWLKDGEKTLGRQTWVMSNQGNGQQVFFQREMLSGFEDVHDNSGKASPDLGRLDAPSQSDTRILPGQEVTLVFSKKVAGGLEKARNPVLKVRVYHAAIHPGFKGSRIDPKLGPPKLFREQTIPIQIGQVLAKNGL